MKDTLRELTASELDAVAGGWGYSLNGGNVVVSFLNGNQDGNLNGNGNLQIASGNGSGGGAADGNGNGNGNGNTIVG